VSKRQKTQRRRGKREITKTKKKRQERTQNKKTRKERDFEVATGVGTAEEKNQKKRKLDPRQRGAGAAGNRHMNTRQSKVKNKEGKGKRTTHYGEGGG